MAQHSRSRSVTTVTAGNDLHIVVDSCLQPCHARRFDAACGLARTASYERVVIDLRALDQVDSVALGMLVMLRKKLKAAGCAVAFLLPADRFERVYAMAGFK